MSDPRPPSLLLIAAVTALGFIALHSIVPALPQLAAIFDVPGSQVQLVLTLYFIGIGSGQLIYGPISDRFGRRPVLIFGLALFLGGTLLCGIAWSLEGLIAGRVLEAVGACAGVVLGRAIVRDVYEHEAAARGLAIVMLTMTIASAFAPAIGAFLVQWFGWRTVFAVLGAIGTLVLAIVAMRLPETNRTPTRLDLVGMAGSYVTLLRSPAFLGFALCTAATSASWFVFIASAPFLLSELMHEPPSTYGLMILLPMGAYMIGNAASARFSVRVGSMTMLVAGLVLSLVSGLVMVLWCFAALNPWALFIPMAVSGIGNGMSQPPSVAAALSVYPRIAGAASGLLGCLQMAASAFGSFAVGALPHDSLWPMLIAIVGSMVLAMVFAVPAIRRPLRAAKSTGGIATAKSGSN